MLWEKNASGSRSAEHGTSVLLFNLHNGLGEVMCPSVSEVFDTIKSTHTRKMKPMHLPSLSTLVRTIYPSPHRLIASAVCSGSCGSRGGGVRDVFTAQNLHPLVQVSPMSLEKAYR